MINWREQILLNQRKTNAVMLCFVLIYIFTGLVLDITYLYIQHHQTSLLTVITQFFKQISNGTLFPFFTCTMVFLAAVFLLITVFRSNQMILSGTNYQKVSRSNTNSPEETQLLNIVEEMKIASQINFLPQTYIIDSPVMNAFASGWNEKSCMIAVTSSLLKNLNRDELQAVIAHEISHIKHQDTRLMAAVTMLSSLLIFFIDILIRILPNPRRRFHHQKSNKQTSPIMIMVFVLMVLRFILPVITLVLKSFLSRVREFMADSSAVSLTRDNQSLANALIKISESNHSDEAKEYYSDTHHESLRYSSYIFDPKEAGMHAPNLNHIIRTHPPLEKRLSAIGIKKQKPE